MSWFKKQEPQNHYALRAIMVNGHEIILQFDSVEERDKQYDVLRKNGFAKTSVSNGNKLFNFALVLFVEKIDKVPA